MAVTPRWGTPQAERAHSQSYLVPADVPKNSMKKPTTVRETANVPRASTQEPSWSSYRPSEGLPSCWACEGTTHCTWPNPTCTALYCMSHHV